MKKLILFAILTAILSISQIKAQKTENADMPVRAFQFTLMFPPLSTNGIQCAQIANNFSFNTFAGVNGGVDGIEIGGFVNTTKSYVKGCQLSGFANVVGGDVDAAQLAGFCNVNNGSTKGLQAAGFTNIVADDVEAVQLAGFSNVNKGKTNGLQIAGFSNTVADDVTGAQLAGFCNVNKGVTNGMQAAGFTNIAAKGKCNAQISGFLNIAENIDGVQVAGFANIAKKVEGVQVAGFINVCDSIDGVPVGFISIVRKNGYRKFEFSTSEYMYLGFAFKMGVKRFYNIYSISKLPRDGNRWAYGFGLGTERDMGESLTLNIDAIAHQELWIGESSSENNFGFLHTSRLNMLNQLKLNFGYKVSENTKVFGGPTLNVSVTDSNSGYKSYAMGPSWAFLNNTSTYGTNVKSWIGFNAGINF